MGNNLDDKMDTEMDCRLRRCFAKISPPAISCHFDQQLHKRLRSPVRLSRVGRALLGIYALAALALSVWLMRSVSIEWPLLILAVAVPVTIAYVVNYICLLRHPIRV